MFQELLSNETKSNLTALKANAEFLDQIVQSLKQTYEVETIVNKREYQYEAKVEIGKPGNYYARRKNLFFNVSNKGVMFTSQVYYASLKCFGMEEYYEGTGQEFKYKVKGEPPSFVQMSMERNSSCGNSYEFKFTLSKDDKDLTDKLKFIMQILDTNGFIVRL